MVGTRDEKDIREIGVEHVVTRSVRDSAAMFALTEDSGPGAQHPPVGLVTASLGGPVFLWQLRRGAR